jgi:ClpP class serine protease
MGLNIEYISAGKYKTLGNDAEALSEDGRALMQGRIDQYYGLFVDAVARGRGVKASEVRGGFGEGYIVGAKDAVKMGMADRVGTLGDTIARLAGTKGAGARADAAGDAPMAEAITPVVDFDAERRRRRLDNAMRRA